MPKGKGYNPGKQKSDSTPTLGNANQAPGKTQKPLKTGQNRPQGA